MELTVLDVARMTGVTARSVQRAARAGALAAHRQVGASFLFDDIAAIAWSRMQGKGRGFSPRVREAAMEIFEGGRTALLCDSERSRLRARLRVMTVSQFVYSMGGLGGEWARYRAAGSLVGTTPIHLIDAGVTGTTGRTFVQVVDLDSFERDNPVILDADGSLGVIQRRGELTEGRRLLDTYLLADSRVSGLAAASIEEKLHAGY